MQWPFFEIWTEDLSVSATEAIDRLQKARVGRFEVGFRGSIWRKSFYVQRAWWLLDSNAMGPTLWGRLRDTDTGSRLVVVATLQPITLLILAALIAATTAEGRVGALEIGFLFFVGVWATVEFYAKRQATRRELLDVLRSDADVFD